MLAVIAGEMSIAEAARRGKASEQSIANWKRLFLESGKPGPKARERQLLEELEELKAALGEWETGWGIPPDVHGRQAIRGSVRRVSMQLQTMPCYCNLVY